MKMKNLQGIIRDNYRHHVRKPASNPWKEANIISRLFFWLVYTCVCIFLVQQKGVSYLI